MEMKDPPRDVLERHLRLSKSGDEEDFMASYGQDSFIILLVRHPDPTHPVYRGREGIRDCYRSHLRKYLINPRFTYNLHAVEGDMGILDWAAEAEDHIVTDGVDSYLIRDGYIQGQTVHYSVEPRRQTNA